jgi:hypothetical protein
MLPLALMGLATGALRLAQNPVVRKAVGGLVKGALSGLQSTQIKQAGGLVPSMLGGAVKGLTAQRTASLYPRKRRKRRSSRYYSYDPSGNKYGR